VEEHEDIKRVQNFIPGSNRGILIEKLPLTLTFQPFKRFSQTVYRSIQLDYSRNKQKPQISAIFHSRGATGNFS
jgi:hypothetical protein